jgi:hypothetical protein
MEPSKAGGKRLFDLGVVKQSAEVIQDEEILQALEVTGGGDQDQEQEAAEWGQEPEAREKRPGGVFCAAQP